MSYTELFETNTGGLSGYRSNLKAGDLAAVSINTIPLANWTSTGAVAYYIIGPTGATGHQGLAGPTGPAAPFPDGRGIVAPYYFNEGSSIGITHHYTQSTSGYTGLNTIYGERNFNDTSISDHVTILGYGSLPVQQQAVGGTYNIAIGTDSMNGSTNTAGNVSIGNQANYFLNGSSSNFNVVAGDTANDVPVMCDSSVILGYGASSDLQSGIDNVSVGYMSQAVNSDATVFGAGAFVEDSEGTAYNGNIVLGANAKQTNNVGYSLSIGDSNFANNSRIQVLGQVAAMPPSQLKINLGGTTYYMPLYTARL